MKYGFSISCLMLNVSLASALSPSQTNPATQSAVYHFAPGFSLSVQGGTGLFSEGKVVGMVPMRFQDNALLYGMIQGQYANSKDWLFSVGMGGRYLLDTHRLIGGYLCLDRLTSSRNHVFWLLNPGVELLTQYGENGASLGLSMNTYLPVSTSQYHIGNIGGHEVTDPYYLSQINLQASYRQIETIRFGLDTRLAYSFARFKYATAELGGYFFNHIHQPLYGIEVGVDFRLSQYLAVSVKGASDNVQRSIMVGLRLSLGGILPSSGRQAMNGRLLAPMQRYIAPLSHMTSVMLVETQPDYLAAHQQQLQQLQEKLQLLQQTHPAAIQKIQTLSQEVQRLQDLTVQIVQQEAQIREQNESIQEKERALKEQARLMSDQTEQIAQRDSRINEQNNTIEEKAAVIGQQTAQIAQQSQRIQARESQIQTLQPFNERLNELSTRIQTTRAKIEELERVATTLNNQVIFYKDVAATPVLSIFSWDRDQNTERFESYHNRLKRNTEYKPLVADRPDDPLSQLLLERGNSTFLEGVNTTNPYQPIRTRRIQALAVIARDATESKLKTTQTYQAAFKNMLQDLETLQGSQKLVQDLMNPPPPYSP